MRDQEFTDLVQEQFKLRYDILCDPKKKRTAGSDDRLINFKRMAAAANESESQVIMGLCIKQFIDLIDMADGNHAHSDDLDYLKELCADVQNYMDLLVAVETERLSSDD